MMRVFSVPVQQGRNQSLDVLRGIGIILVVIGHALRGIDEAGLMPNQAVFQTIDAAIYAFHMPLFFFLSGLVFTPRLLTPVAPTLSSLVLRLVYPIFVWTYLFNIAKAAAGTMVNTPVTWPEVFIFPLPPNGTHLWFLWALFVIQSVILLSQVMRGGERSLVRALVLFVLTFVAFAILARFEFPFRYVVWLGFYHAPFFALGLVCVSLLSNPPRGAPVTLAASAVFLGLLWFAVTTDTAQFARIALACVLVLTFVVAVMATEPWARGTKTWAALQMFGAASMAIYLAHTFFSAFTRIALVKMDITATSLHVVAGVVTGLFLPLALLNLSRRYRFARVLGF